MSILECWGTGVSTGLSVDGCQDKSVDGRGPGQERRGTDVRAGVSFDGCQFKRVDGQVSV